MKSYQVASPEETLELGRSFAGSLNPGDVVALFGNLGTGKTQFVRGVCEGLGIQARVTSPTFTLINEYPAPFGVLAHVDLYRIQNPRELTEIGLESYFRDSCICLIEWAEQALPLLPPFHSVKLAYGSGETERLIEIRTVEEAVA